ncbi:hypothetical protein M758_UG120400 [Ceratodon purpureus]|nr:hypothetical protein M758_UG120400 [Ceratodon purpureus]
MIKQRARARSIRSPESMQMGASAPPAHAIAKVTPAMVGVVLFLDQGELRLEVEGITKVKKTRGKGKQAAKPGAAEPGIIERVKKSRPPRRRKQLELGLCATVESGATGVQLPEKVAKVRKPRGPRSKIPMAEHGGGEVSKKAMGAYSKPKRSKKRKVTGEVALGPVDEGDPASGQVEGSVPMRLAKARKAQAHGGAIHGGCFRHNKIASRRAMLEERIWYQQQLDEEVRDEFTDLVRAIEWNSVGKCVFV